MVIKHLSSFCEPSPGVQLSEDFLMVSPYTHLKRISENANKDVCIYNTAHIQYKDQIILKKLTQKKVEQQEPCQTDK